MNEKHYSGFAPGRTGLVFGLLAVAFAFVLQNFGSGFISSQDGQLAQIRPERQISNAPAAPPPPPPPPRDPAYPVAEPANVISGLRQLSSSRDSLLVGNEERFAAEYFARAYYATADSLRRLRDSLAKFTDPASNQDSLSRGDTVVSPSDPRTSEDPTTLYKPGERIPGTAVELPTSEVVRDVDLVLLSLLLGVFVMLASAIYLAVLQPLFGRRSNRRVALIPDAGFPKFLFEGGGVLLLALTLPAAFYCWLADPLNLKRTLQVALLCATGGLALWYMRARHDRFADPYDALQFMGGAVGLPNTVVAAFMID